MCMDVCIDLVVVFGIFFGDVYVICNVGGNVVDVFCFFVIF